MLARAKQQFLEWWEIYSIFFLLAFLFGCVFSGEPVLMAIAIVWAMSRPYA